MAILAPVEVARESRRSIVSNGVAAHLTTFIGANRYNPAAASAEPPGSAVVYPMAFLVERPAGSVVATHFHEANQFQIVVAGDGKLGSHPVEPVAVHYSRNAFSAYGPITAGAKGLQYFTLRNGYDRGARYLPAAREEMRGVKPHLRRLRRKPPSGAIDGGSGGGLRRCADPRSGRWPGARRRRHRRGGAGRA